MTKLQLLHRAVSERLQAAVEQIMEMVGGTVLEYEEETVRARTENEILRRRLRWMEGENATDWPDPTERTALPAPREADFSQPEQQHDSMKGLLDLDALIIKTESIEASDFEAFGHNTSLTAAMCGVNLETVTPGTSASAETGTREGVVWDSAHSYMAPLDFDPTLPIARSRSQRMSFACPDCGKVFGREQRLMFHMRIHSTERPYAYRRRKTCFYGDKKRKKKIRGFSNLSREFVDDLSDTSEHTERSTGSANVSVSVTAEPSAPEADPSEASDGVSEHTGSSKYSESSAAKPVALKPKQRTEKAKIHQCQQCNRAYAHLSRLAIHMRTHQQPLPSQEEKKEQEDTDKTNKKSQQHVKPVKSSGAESSKADVIKKIFACPYCDKVFTREGWLAPHIRSHALKMSPKKNVNPDSHVPDSAHRRTRRNITQPFKQSRESSNEGEHVLEEESTSEKSEILANQPENQLGTSVTECITVELQTNSEIQISNEPENTNNDSEAISTESNSITKKITEESIGVPEEPTSETGGTKKSKKIFPCRECGKVYLLAGWLKTHKKMHKKMDKKEKKNKIKKMNDLEMQPNFQNKKKKKKQPTNEPMLTDVDKSSHVQPVEDQSKESGDKATGRCICKECGKVYARKNWLRLHMLGHNKAMLTLQESVNDKTQSDGQTEKGDLSTENSTVQKGKDGGKALFPCPFCDKVFPRSMRLMVHMQIHSGEKPYSYRQRKDQLYSDLTRSRVPEPDKPEPAVESSDEKKNDVGNEMPRDQIPTLSQDHSTPEPVDTVHHQSVHTGRKFSLLPLHSAGATTINSTNHPSADSKSDSHFSLQPRIVLDPLTAQSKHSEGEDFRPGVSETSDTELPQRSDPERIHAASEAQVKHLTQSPLESSNDVVHHKFDSVCKSVDNTSCSNKVVIGDQQTSECSVSKKVDVWRENNCDYSTFDEEQDATVNLKPDHTSVISSFSAKQQVPQSESGYMVFSDISDEEEWSNASNNLNDKTSFIFPSEGLADNGAFVISALSPSQKVNDSNKAEDGGPPMKRVKVVEPEPQTGDSRSTEQKSWYTCVTCGTSFATEAALIQHMKVHAVSGSTDKNSKAFKTHKKRVKNNESKVNKQVFQAGESIRDEGAAKDGKNLK